VPEFRVIYERQMSTVGQEIKTDREVTLEFSKRPTRSDLADIERQLEESFISQHRGNLKNLLAISCKVKRVLLKR
jgi:hypothetical protein